MIIMSDGEVNRSAKDEVPLNVERFMKAMRYEGEAYMLADLKSNWNEIKADDPELHEAIQKARGGLFEVREIIKEYRANQ